MQLADVTYRRKICAGRREPLSGRASPAQFRWHRAKLILHGFAWRLTLMGEHRLREQTQGGDPHFLWRLPPSLSAERDGGNMQNKRRRRRNAEDGVPYGLALIRRLTAPPSPKGKAFRADSIRPYGFAPIQHGGCHIDGGVKVLLAQRSPRSLFASRFSRACAVPCSLRRGKLRFFGVSLCETPEAALLPLLFPKSLATFGVPS